MTYTPELSTAFVRDERLELHRRMWVLRLLDMALEELRIDRGADGAPRSEFGQEAVVVGTVAALRPGDILTATSPRFRHALQIGLSLPLGPAIAEMFGPRRSVRVGSQDAPLVADWTELLSTESALGQSMLFALGDAHAQRMAGDGNVTVCVVGVGDANCPEFAAAANVAVSWRLPVVFVVENIHRTPSASSAPRPVPKFHEMPMLSVDGRNVAAVSDSVAGSVLRASVGDGPFLVEASTYRTNHPAAVDPLVFLRRQLLGAGVSGGHLNEVECRSRHLVAEAVSFAKARLRAQPPTSVCEPDPWSAAS
jgi:TPP-dependent pyruvate/acetoin dehydrogenase alpha subunit